MMALSIRYGANPGYAVLKAPQHREYFTIMHPLKESDENVTLEARACDDGIPPQPRSLAGQCWVVITANIWEGHLEA